MLVGQFGIDVVLSVFILLQFFELGEFVTDFGVIFLEQTLLKSLNGLCVTFLLGEDGSLTGKYFGLLDIVLSHSFLEEFFGMCYLG